MVSIANQIIGNGAKGLALWVVLYKKNSVFLLLYRDFSW